MASPTEIAFVIVHSALNAFLIGGLTVTLAATREVYPRWSRYPFARVVLDVLISALLLLLVILVAIRLTTAP